MEKDSFSRQRISNAGPTIPNCIFTDNTAYAGGAVFIADGSATVTESRFENNTATIGGAISAFTSAQVEVADSHFESNAANLGGAVAVLFGSFGQINDSVLENNHATEIDAGGTDFIGGGAVFVAAIPDVAPASVDINNSQFIGNAANPADGGVGGAVAAVDAAVFINNSLLMNNHALQGGGLWIDFIIGTIDGATFAGNSADDAGGAAYITKNGYLNISVSFFCGSNPDHITGPHGDRVRGNLRLHVSRPR